MLPKENPRIPDHINNPDTNALGEFIQLVLGIGLLIVLLVSAAALAANILAPHVPYSWEPHMADYFETAEEFQLAQQDLQQLSDELSATMNLPEGMQPVVHLAEGPPNAFAFLGGNIVVTEGLLESVQSENGLAMVIAHEIAHLKHRHPIAALGRGIVISLVMSAILGSDASAVASNIMGSAGTLTMLGFNRSMESDADKEAINAIIARYGHTQGADEFFQYVLKDKEEPRWQAWLSTHPLSKDRIDSITSHAITHKHEVLEPLPASVISLLEDTQPISSGKEGTIE